MTRDMIHDCKMAGLAEPEFSLTDGFVATVYRKPGVLMEEFLNVFVAA